jgi:hypothetical protein
MNEKIESIINDLYAIDPTLREHDARIRALVATLIEVKPRVEIDQIFVTALRAQLLSSVQKTQIHSAQPTRESWNYWLFRLAPVGAIAVLFIALAPQLTQVGIPTDTNTPSPEQGTMMMQTTQSDTFSVTPPAAQKSLVAQNKQMGFISKITLSPSPELLFDDAVWSEAGAEDGQFIENKIKKNITLSIEKDAHVIMQTLNAETENIKNTEITLAEFAKLMSDTTLQWSKLPYIITIQNDKIILIEEVYIP